MEGSGDEENVTCQVGTVQGEDYTFRFGGKIVDGKLHFRLNMEYEGEDDEVIDCDQTNCLLCGRAGSERRLSGNSGRGLPYAPSSLADGSSCCLNDYTFNCRSRRTDSRAPSTLSSTPTLTRRTRLPSTSARSLTSAAQTGAVQLHAAQQLSFNQRMWCIWGARHP